MTVQIVGAIIGIGILGWVLGLEVVHAAEGAETRTVPALVLLLCLMVFAFSLSFYLMERVNPASFDGLHTRVDALYFTLVTMATVGYGDVHAEGQGARLLVIGLIVFDVVIVASLVRLLPQSPAQPPGLSVADTPRRGRPGYDADTILRRAVDLFIRQGYEATSMGDLATELGLSKSAIYHHVPSKEHLLAAALDEALDGLSAAIDDAVEAAALRSYDRLQAAVRSSVEVLVAHLPAVTLLLRVRGNSAVEIAALRRRRELDDRLAELVRAAVDEGRLRDDVPRS